MMRLEANWYSISFPHSEQQGCIHTFIHTNPVMKALCFYTNKMKYSSADKRFFPLVRRLLFSGVIFEKISLLHITTRDMFSTLSMSLEHEYCVIIQIHGSCCIRTLCFPQEYWNWICRHKSLFCSFSLTKIYWFFWF